MTVAMGKGEGRGQEDREEGKIRRGCMGVIVRQGRGSEDGGEDGQKRR